MYGSIGDQIMRKPSIIESKSEVEYNFKSHKLDELLEDKNYKGGNSMKILSKTGDTSLTLKTQRDQVIESIKLLAICHE
jgi:hypothetical protein